MFNILKVKIYKYIVFVFVFYFLFITIFSAILYPFHRANRLEQIQEDLILSGKTLSGIIASDYEKVLDKDTRSQTYRRLRNTFKTFYEVNSSLKYLYSFSKIDGVFKFVIAGSSQDFTPASFMFNMSFEDIDDILEGIGYYGNSLYSFNMVDSEEWGRTSELYIPITNNDDEVIGYIGMAKDTSNLIRLVLIPYLIVSFVILLLGNLIILFMFLVIKFTIINPILELLHEVKRLANYDFSYSDKCTKYFYKQDEVGELIRSTAQMKLHFIHFLDNIEFNAQTTKDAASSLIDIQGLILDDSEFCENSPDKKCVRRSENLINISGVIQELIAVSQQSLDNINQSIIYDKESVEKTAKILKDYNIKKERGGL